MILNTFYTVYLCSFTSVKGQNPFGKISLQLLVLNVSLRLFSVGLKIQLQHVYAFFFLLFYLMAAHCFFHSSSKCFPRLRLSGTSALASRFSVFYFLYWYVLSVLRRRLDKSRPSKIHPKQNKKKSFIIQFLTGQQKSSF